MSSEPIIKEIKKRGPVTFAQYMDLALYHPESGYYMNDVERIGKSGDFYTSSDVSSYFGVVLADQFYQMWNICGNPEKWTLAEYGAGKGLLAGDILSHCYKKYPDFFKSMEYIIVEKSPSMIQRQKNFLNEIKQPSWGIHWETEQKKLISVQGCVFSNELLDSFPVNRIIRENGKYFEIYVYCDKGELREVNGPVSSVEIEDYLNKLPFTLEEGQIIEINLGMRRWLFQIAGYLDEGFLLTIDYGDKLPDIFSQHRIKGTLRTYHKHCLGDSLYKCPGSQDITAHVNFTDLEEWGRQAGFETVGYNNQMSFLINLGIINYLQDLKTNNVSGAEFIKETMAVKKLVMAEGMGNTFKVMAQYKGLDSKPTLKGFPDKKFFIR